MKTAFAFAPGSAEALKWLALLLMTADHVNTFLLDGAYAVLYAAGRVAFPLFAFVLASNLARPGLDLARIFRRLVLFGAIAAVPFVMLGHALPLNVMFTFAAAAALVACVERGWWIRGVALFAIAGAYVDYQWPGLAFIVAAWWFFRTGAQSPQAAALMACGLAGLAWPNGNWWALAALPIAMAAEIFAPHVPRLRWAFYAYYPAHVALLAILA